MDGSDRLGAIAPTEDQFRRLMDALPAAVYVTDAQGVIRFANRAAEEFAGRRAEVDRDRWCVTHRLYNLDGQHLPQDKCPMAMALTERRPVRGVEILAERPDGERVPVMPFPTPLFDDAGEMIGAVNLLLDVSELRRTEAALARRAEDQATLYRFTDRLYRAGSLDEVHDAALDAITAGLRCERASIQMFDDGGVMRFTAWRGLSDSYRAAVEGRSPWTPDVRDPQPIWVEDFEATDRPEGLKAAIRDGGICAIASIPLLAGGVLVGKFMAYYSAPHAFTTEERDLAVTIARQLGFNIEQSRARDRLRASEERFRAIVETTPECVKLVSPDGGLLHMNSSGLAIIGASSWAEVAGRSFYDVVSPADRAAFAAMNERVCRGEPASLAFDVVSRDGRIRHMETRAVPFRDFDGSTIQLAVSRDVSDRVHAEEQRTLLINELNHRVKNTLATVQSLARQTLRNTDRSAEACDRLESRLEALARAHDILTRESWSSADLRDVLERGLEPFGGQGARIQLCGPSVRLSPRQALALSLALHELANNAAKYGALTPGEGRVRVSWAVTEGELRLDWEEVGGPPVSPPQRKGFGCRLLERSLRHDLGAAASLEYRPTGVLARIRTPLSRPQSGPVDAVALG